MLGNKDPDSACALRARAFTANIIINYYKLDQTIFILFPSGCF